MLVDSGQQSCAQVTQEIWSNYGSVTRHRSLKFSRMVAFGSTEIAGLDNDVHHLFC